MKKYLIIATLLFSQISQAVCNQSVSYLKEGDFVPCNGYLFTPEKELDVRIKLVQLDKLQELSKKQDEMIGILSQRIDNQIQQNILIEKELNDRKQQDYWKYLLSFGLGALLTGGLASALYHAK